jgi:DNA-binding NarL/FixJ family response regulator
MEVWGSSIGWRFEPVAGTIRDNMAGRDTGRVMEPIQVLLVDDEPSVLRGLRMRLGLEVDIRVVGEAADGATAVDLAGLLSPDVVLMDVNLPVLDGITATRELAARVPQVAVVILSLHDDQATIDRAIAAGAAAFVGKQETDGNLLGAIRMAAERTKGGALGNKKEQTNESGKTRKINGRAGDRG